MSSTYARFHSGQWSVLAVEPSLGLGVILCELRLYVVHDRAVDYEEQVR